MERDFKKLRYLIVDDSSQARRIIANSLKAIGCENFIEAGDSEETLSKLAIADSIDFLITAWSMPDLPPREMVKTIRASEQTEKLPILMITGQGDGKNIVEAFDAGVNSCLLRPFFAAMLQKKIESILASLQV